VGEAIIALLASPAMSLGQPDRRLVRHATGIGQLAVGLPLPAGCVVGNVAGVDRQLSGGVEPGQW
jgi:hypothetical protein